MKMCYVTTSWDDGDILDMKLSEMLAEYGLKGTFYVPKHCTDSPLALQDIRELHTLHEVGAHTLSHAILTKVPADVARDEIAGSKDYLEDLLGEPVPMFCYPQGRYSSETVQMVKEAGFLGARTVERFCVALPENPFEMGMTIHLYPHPLRKQSRDRLLWSRAILQPFRQNYQGIRQLRLPWRSYVSWQAMAKSAFDYVLTHGGVWHLYGHSWEIEKYGMWQELRNIVKYVAQRPGVEYVDNRSLIRKNI